jgi:predicted MFS family arabinose efflux permease
MLSIPNIKINCFTDSMKGFNFRLFKKTKTGEDMTQHSINPINPFNPINSRQGNAVLILAFVMGMVDMVALPVWVGTLMQNYGYSPSQAGLTVTLFLLGVVLVSTFLSPKFNRLPRRVLTASGFGLAAVVFYLISLQALSVNQFATIAVLHALAGVGVGTALSFTHGSIGRSANPHRLWAFSNIALGVFAVVFMASVPPLMASKGASVLFSVFAGLMLLGCVVAAFAFPQDKSAWDDGLTSNQAKTAIPKGVWYLIAAVICLVLNQAMVFSFAERIGAAHGFVSEDIHKVLIAVGLVALLPGALAAFLQTRWSPIAVGITGPVMQAVLALTMTLSISFSPYAVAAALYVSVVIFTHTFLFGLLAKLDTSGRIVAATPAMMMIGSCIGPALGGGVVQAFGYPGLGYAACLVAAIAVTCILRGKRALSL